LDGVVIAELQLKNANQKTAGFGAPLSFCPMPFLNGIVFNTALFWQNLGFLDGRCELPKASDGCFRSGEL
jgi:hypothetical protein